MCVYSRFREALVDVEQRVERLDVGFRARLALAIVDDDVSMQSARSQEPRFACWQLHTQREHEFIVSTEL